MDKIFDSLISAFGQVIFVLILCGLAYAVSKLINKKDNLIFLHYIGFKNANLQLDKGYAYITAGVILFSIVTTYFQFNDESFKVFLLADTSPYGKILKNGFGISQIVQGFIYCFLAAGASEEILFRGLIGRRLFAKFGLFKGNIIQAFVFWIMHLLIFRLVTGSWVSWFQVYAFIVSFGLGLLLGFVNNRKNGQSITPSWLLHSIANFATFLTLAALI